MQVGPPGAVDPDLGRRVGVDLAAGGRQCRRGPRVPLGEDDDPRAHGQDVAAERRELLVGHLDQPDPELAEQRPQPDREERQVDDRQVVGDGRDDREQVDELGRAAPVRHVEDPDVAPDQAGELPRALGVGPQRPPDAQQVRPEPEGVAALDRAGRLDPPDRRDPGGARPGLDGGRLGRPVGLARPERDRPPIGHQQRIEGVDEIGRLELGLERVDADAQPGRGCRRRRRARVGRARDRPDGGTRGPDRRTRPRRPGPVA